MESYRKTANNRSEFAREKYTDILKSFTITKNGTLIDVISGYKARKLNQAYQIYIHYLFVFNGSKPLGTAIYIYIYIYKVNEENVQRRKKNRNFKSRRQLYN